MTEPVRACPACGKTMEVRRAHGAEIDRCPGCEGYWFDASELTRAAAGVLPRIEPKGPSARRCPACAVALQSALMEGVAIERCATCRGTWLDAGEFSKVEAAAQPLPQRKTPRPSASDETQFARTSAPRRLFGQLVPDMMLLFPRKPPR